jgi:predicted metallopeptidase
LEEQKKKKGSEIFASGINVIEVNIAVSSIDPWVLDIRSMIHTCKSLQVLSLTRRFAKGELDVCVSNGAKVATIAVGTFHLLLPSGLVLELNNCYCIPALCKNIITSSCLEKVDGYKIIIKIMHCSIYYNGIFYAHCALVNGLYVLHLEDKSLCNNNAKRA